MSYIDSQTLNFERKKSGFVHSGLGVPSDEPENVHDLTTWISAFKLEILSNFFFRKYQFI